MEKRKEIERSTETLVKYSDAELAEFRDLISKKLEAATRTIIKAEISKVLTNASCNFFSVNFLLPPLFQGAKFVDLYVFKNAGFYFCEIYRIAIKKTSQRPQVTVILL